MAHHFRAPERGQQALLPADMMEWPLRANDDETRTPREITLEVVEGLHRSCP